MPSTRDLLTPEDTTAQLAENLARQLHLPRIVGVVLCAICVGVTLYEQDEHFNTLAGLAIVLNVVLWPEVARWLTRRSRRPMRAEMVNLWLDAVSAGFWAVAMQGALVPSAVLLMSTSLSLAAMGGPRLMVRGWSGHIVGFAIGCLVWGWHFQPISTTTGVLGAVPMLMAYPLLMGCFMHRLTQRLQAKRRELRFLSEHDALSGVHNRRFFDQALRQSFSQFQRHERQLSLLVGDVDHFKRINDQFGHAAGDDVIRAFGAALKSCARTGDVVARLGGDEFVVLLYDTDAEQAFHYARRVQAHLCEGNAQLRHLPEVRVSFGVAMARPQMKSHEHWLEQADRALYRTKEQDRGGISFAGNGEEPFQRTGYIRAA